MDHVYHYPRPEYPRPERQRGTREGHDWLNLNGPWEFRFDKNKTGEQEGWEAAGEKRWREQIIVPFCWESLAAWGEGDTAGNEHYFSTRPYRNPLQVTKVNHRAALRWEIGWYRRRVTIPNLPEWEGKRVILTVGAADFFTKAWCNGTYLGDHEGGYTPFEFDLTDALETQPDGTRTGLVVFRVEDPMKNSEQPVGKQWRWYTSVSGIWQTVFIEPRNREHIERFRITPDIDRSVAGFKIYCEDAERCEVQVDIDPPERGDRITHRFKVADGVASGEINIDPLLLWDPNQPYLYDAVLTLRKGGTELDQVKTYFGMRKIDSAPDEDPKAPAVLRLNNKPRYLRGALYQSFFPEGVYTAGDVETIKGDIEWAKKFGFNFLRIHIKLDDPLALYWADKMGVMLMADFPNFGEGGDTDIGRKRFETMMKAGIERDFNHPSIIAWCLFNETWGFGGQVGFVELISPEPEKDPEDPNPLQPPAEPLPGPQSKLRNLSSHAWVRDTWELAKKLDPTRLVEDMSVCHWGHLEYFLHGETDINSWHFYTDNYKEARAHIAKVVENTYRGSEFNYVPGFSHGGEPLINSEYGGVGALDGDRDISWSFKFLTNELRRHGAISAYIYTELTDVEWEYNGLLNYNRTPKELGYDARLINESNQIPVDAPPIQKVAPGQKVTIPVASSHYSTRHYKDVTLKWRLSGQDRLSRLHQDVITGEQPINFPHHRVAPAADIVLTMPETPMLATLHMEAVARDGTILARNFIHILVSDAPPPPVQESDRGAIRRLRPQDWAEARWTGGHSKRSEAEKLDCCYGRGSGHFTWVFPLEGIDLDKVIRMRLLFEMSARREDTPQTDNEAYETDVAITAAELPLYKGRLRNHPHDALGVLSYLRGGKGAYGYLVSATAEREQLQNIKKALAGQQHLTIRTEVSSQAKERRGLTIYGAECGRFPFGPTLQLEW